MKNTNTDRIEEALNIVAEKIINLENTAKHLEFIKNGFSKEIKDARNIKFELNTENIDKSQKVHVQRIESVHNNYLHELEKKNTFSKYMYYFLIFQTVALILTSSLTVHYYSKMKKDKAVINTYYQSFIHENSLDNMYLDWQKTK